MFKKFIKIGFILFTAVSFAQVGHLMQGVGAVNMSMGGAATAQPLDISGAMQWNSATLSTFDGSILKFDIGMFKGTPTVYSSLPKNAMGPGSPAISGATESDLGISMMPAIAFAWGKAESKHKFGVSVFGVSGFGVDFAEETNVPPSAFGTPTDSNPIFYPQTMNGFGHLESSYMLMQVGFTWAYKISEKLSIGVQPTFNYSMLELSPNPLANPRRTSGGYAKTDKATAVGIGSQLGVFYDTKKGFKFGASFKSPQYFKDFEFDNTYPNGDTGTNEFKMNFPAIYSIGLGYSKADFDVALDYRYVDYANTDGFEASGWKIASEGPMKGYPTGAVNGFGWNSISVLSAGIQYKGIDKLPLRLGYTYSTNPIEDELTMFSLPATAIIAHAFQFGLSFDASEKFTIDAVGHYGISDGKTSGQILNPTPAVDFNGDGVPDGPWDATNNPLGKIPGSSVAYDMKTWMFQIGVSYKFGK